MSALTARQWAVLALALALGAAAIVAASFGRGTLAIALVGGLAVVVFVMVLQVHRRLGQGLEELGGLRALQGRRHLELPEEVERGARR